MPCERGASHGVTSLRPAPHPARSLLVVALLSAWGVVGVLLPAAAEPTDTELRERRTQLEAEREGLSGQLERAEDERSQLSGALAEATATVERLTGELNRLRDETGRLAGEIDALEQHAEATRASLARRVNALYRGTATSELMGLVGGTSVGDVTDRSHYLAAMSRHDRTELERAAAVETRLAQRRAELAEATARQEEVAEQARVAQSELGDQLTAAAASVDGVRGQIATRQRQARTITGELHNRKETRAAAEAAARRAAEQEAAAERAERQSPPPRSAQTASRSARRVEPVLTPDSQPDPGGGDGMACPQDQPRSFTDTWGAPRSGGRSHQGTDIFGARGGEVFAISSGTVEWTRSGSNSGLWLSLRADNGDRYWYMHLQGFVASAGQRVGTGNLIAYNGDTGNARGTNPHIHFELHPGGGRPVNPYPLLRRACG